MFPFKEIWAVDFEFIKQDGESLPRPVCLVAWELKTRRRIRLWQDEFGKLPPYSLAPESLFVSFSAPAELSCHLALGWPMPARILDLYVEFRRVINTTPVDARFKNAKLLDALTYYGLDGIGSGEKEKWRDLIMRGGPWTEEEREGILVYCETDVTALRQLLPAMHARSHIDLRGALVRGRYMAAVTRMESTGVPIDMERFQRLQERWGEPLKKHLIATLGAAYGDVYDAEGSFGEARFARWLIRRGWGWPVLDSGRLDLKDGTFKDMAKLHPELEPLRQLRYTLDNLKLNELIVGPDGFNRCWLQPFGSRTGRNQPSNKHFIFGPAVWLRDFLIQPKEGWGLAYIDWVGQEAGIAAALSGDPAMLKAYKSPDFYIAFGKQGSLLPSEATKETHGDIRDALKITSLSTQYGTGARALADRLDAPPIVARNLLACHHRVFHIFWEWSDNRVSRSFAYNRQDTVFGWTHKFLEHPKANAVRNFFMQGNGAEMMRLAACLATENGIQVCAPVHDAFLIMAPIGRLEADVERMRAYMPEASAVVLNGYRLKTDEPHIFIYPQRYTDPKGRGKEMLARILELI